MIQCFIRIFFHTLIILSTLSINAYSEPVSQLLIDAESGLAQSQLELGRAYLHGRGITKDLNKAYFWFQKAAEQKSRAAQNGLGYLYENGLGVNQDFKTAKAWYQKAADQGSVAAMYHLGKMYAMGFGVDKNYAKAAEWYGKAAELGNARAQVNLGTLYETGTGVQQSYEQAVSWYIKAAAQNYPRAQTHLGIMYENGLGVKKDLNLAASWYKKAISLNYSKAGKRLEALEKKTKIKGVGVAIKSDSESKLKVVPPPKKELFKKPAFPLIEEQTKTPEKDTLFSPPASFEPGKTFYVLNDTLLVKKNKKEKSSLITGVKKGAQVVIIETQGDWVLVQVPGNDDSGWILSKSLTDNVADANK